MPRLTPPSPRAAADATAAAAHPTPLFRAAVRLQYLIAFSLNVVLFGQYWVLGPDRRGKAPPSARGPGARARGAPYGPQDGARMDSSAPQSWERDTVQKKAS